METKIINRDELINKLKAEFPRMWTKNGEDFGAGHSEDTIWTGEGSYLNDNTPIFDFYGSDNYIFGVHQTVHQFLEEYGYYTEAYDAGTFFIAPN